MTRPVHYWTQRGRGRHRAPRPSRRGLTGPLALTAAVVAAAALMTGAVAWPSDLGAAGGLAPVELGPVPAGAPRLPVVAVPAGQPGRGPVAVTAVAVSDDAGDSSGGTASGSGASDSDAASEPAGDHEESADSDSAPERDPAPEPEPEPTAPPSSCNDGDPQ